MFTDYFSLSLFVSVCLADNSSVIAATATTSSAINTTKNSTDQPQQQQRYPKSCIKKVKFSSESLKSEVDGLCEQLKDNVLNDLSTFNINNNNTNNNNNNIDIKYNSKKMSEQEGTTTNTAETGGEATQSTATDGERPSFLVCQINGIIILLKDIADNMPVYYLIMQVGDEIDEKEAIEAGEAGDQFPQKMQSDIRQNGDIAERRKRLR